MMPTRASALAEAPRGDYFPNIVLRTHENQPLRFYDDLLRGKVVLINFFYVTCGDICPLMTANLMQVQAALGERLGREVFIYSITLDPQTDTPAVLKQYAEGYGAKPGWYFLTGQDEEIQKLRRTLGLYDRDPRIDADKVQHTGLITYGNEATGRWGVVPALLAPERIVRAVLRVMGPQPAVLTPSKP
jgi:protein SCO1/2